jgi:putative peptidoglycan lipid II flippase
MVRDEGQVRHIMWAATLITAATIVSRLLGFVRASLIADFFGQNARVDHYNAAYVLPDTLYLLLIGGAISSAFVPVIAGYLTRGESDEAERVLNASLTTVVVGLVPILALAELFAPAVVRVVAVGFNGNPAAIAATAYLTRIMLIAVLFHGLNGVLIGAQYARKSFWATAIGPLLYNLGIIALGFLFGRIWGIQAFAWGVLVGAFVNFLLEVYAVARLGFHYAIVWDPRHPGLRRVGQLMFPIMFGVGLGQLNLVVNQTFFGSLLAAGTINALNLASRVMMVPVSLAASLAIAILPNLAEVAAAGDHQAFYRYLSGAMRVVIFVSVPATIGFWLVRAPLIAIMFQHGRFTGHDVSVTAAALGFYVMGILPYGAMEVIVRGFYAYHDTRTPVWIGAVALVVGFLSSLLLMRPMQQAGLALAYSITGWTNLLLLMYMLRRRFGPIGATRMLRTGVRTLLAALVMAIGVAMTHVLVAAWTQSAHAAPRIVALVLMVGVGAALFALAARRFHVEEYDLIVSRMFRRRLAR